MDLHPGERVIFEGRPSWRSILSYYLKGLLVALVVGAIAWVASGTGLGVGLFVAVTVLVVLGGILLRIGTRYTITTERLHIRRGLLSRSVQQTNIDRVQNVNTHQSLLERMLRVGTVDFDTAGTDDSEFRFIGVAGPEHVVAAVDRAQRERSTATPPATQV